MSIAKVVVNLSLDREFDYRIPGRLVDRVEIGSRVRVPFGRGDGSRVGYVVGLSAESQVPRLKDILSVEGDRAQIPTSLISLAGWIAEYYCCTREQAVRALLPAAVRSGKVSRRKLRFVSLVPTVHLGDHLPDLERRAPKQAETLRALVRLGTCTARTLAREAGAGPDTLRRLAQRGLVMVEERVVDRDPFADDVILPSEPHELTREQAAAVEQICRSMVSDRPSVILLHGVTGSGKTEVYLQAIATCLDSGREAIVLVPEISLTPQTTERFRSRFGDGVSVLHSGLSDGERLDEWCKISEGRSQIVIGARSALFAPFRNLGLIVVDEEHENSYKQDEAPRYHARDVAVVRGRNEGATVVLGSATPSLESYRNCDIGKYALSELTERVDQRRLPYMELVDMRAEAVLRGGAQIFSRCLVELIRERLACGAQTILFLNRRGYATQMMCTKCGFVANCDDCTVTYTYHRQQQQLVCHLCGRVVAAPTCCPQCKDPEIRYSGLGTEKVEALARKLFPKANIARMDSDTMTRKNAHKKTLLAFRSGRIDILIGTQMIAKGLDFPNVTLVGVVFADLGLYLPDFRAGERTFQLLTQVSGRAGRGERPGHVVVQSYTPYHPALQCALEHNYLAFYEDEMPSREVLEFPPTTHMAIVHFRSSDEEALLSCAEGFAARLKPLLGPETQVAGPMPCPIAKIRGLLRYQLILRGGRFRPLLKQLRVLVLASGAVDPAVDVHVDVDPQSLL